jgi:hypothetical protein
MNTFVMRKILLSLIICLFSASLVLAAGTASIIIKDTSIKLGSTLAMPITVEEANEIAGGSLKLSFDPEIISVQSVASGDFGVPTYNINSDSVLISIAGANAVGKASATLAVVTFKGEKEGSTDLKIEDVDLNKEDGSLVTPSTRNGIVTVGTGVLETQTPPATQTPVATAGNVEQNVSSLKNQPAEATPSGAQNDTVNPGVVTEKVANLKLDQTLYQLATSKDPQALAVQKGINMSGEKVRVVIMLADGADIPGRFNITVEQRDKNLIQALVPVNALLELAKEPGISYVKVPENYKPAGGPMQTSFPTIFSWVGAFLILLLLKHRKKKNGKKSNF